MKLRTRVVILVLFIVGFLITAPLLVLYTAGYRYSFNTGSIVQTGLFYFTTIPKSALVSLDDKERIRTPDFVKNLVPGEYNITISKTGYHDWQKTLPVTSRETTFVEEVVLFLASSPANLISTDLTGAVVDPTGSRIAFTSTVPSWTEVWSYDPTSSEQALLYRIPTDETELEPEIEWSSDGERLLIKYQVEAVKEFVLVDKIGFGRTIMSGLTEEEIMDAWWHPDEPHSVFFNSENGTFVYRIPGQSLTQIYDQPELATLIEGQPVIIETNDSRTSVFRYINNNAEIVAYLPLGTYELIPAADPYLLLHETKKDKLILINTTAGNDPILLNVDGTGLQWAPDGSGRLLYFNNFEVHIYSPDTHYDELITRVGETITGATWHPLGNAILISKQNVIQAAELDSRDQRNIIDLATGSDLANVWIEKTGRRAYFTGEVDPDRGIFELLIRER